MKKLFLLMFIFPSLISCGSKDAKLVGQWVEPVPGMEGMVQGFNLEKGGKASSINMATLQYESWKTEGSNLILTGSSIGNGQTIEFADTLAIGELSDDILVLQKGEATLSYSKQKAEGTAPVEEEAAAEEEAPTEE